MSTIDTVGRNNDDKSRRLPPSIKTMDLYVSNFSSLSKLTRNFHYKENKWNFKNFLLSGGWEISQRVEPHKNEDKDVNPQHAC